MLNIIVGKNSLGKSTYLRNLRKSTNKSVLSNEDIKLLPNYDVIKIDADLLKKVLIELGHSTPMKNDYDIFCIGNEQWSKRYLEILALLCKDVEIILMDEAEDGLSPLECGRIFTAMYVVSTVKEVWCVTHSKEILNFDIFDGVKYWTVDSESGELRIKEIEVDGIEEYNYTI